MRLQTGVKLLLTSSQKACVMVNSGVTIASLDSIYEEKALIPLEGWRLPKYEEEHILFFNNTESQIDYFRSGLFVSIISIPSLIIDPLREVTNLGSFISGNYHRFYGDPQVEQSILTFVEYIEPYCYDIENIRFLGISKNQGGLTTTTSSKNTGKFVGLHIDNWDHMPITDRSTARNRICVNLGCEDRYFLYINLPTVQLLELLYPDTTSNIKTYEFLEKYYGYFSSYPVTRVTVRPGEAYIAPTENLIHDGSTKGKTNNDLTMTFLGNFRIPEIL